MFDIRPLVCVLVRMMCNTRTWMRCFPGLPFYLRHGPQPGSSSPSRLSEVVSVRTTTPEGFAPLIRIKNESDIRKPERQLGLLVEAGLHERTSTPVPLVATAEL